MNIAASTEIRIEDLEFDPPGPGSWGLDLTHYPRPVTRFITDPAAFEDPSRAASSRACAATGP
jgi:hypothetical protein